eukprot:3940245-Rhodomonas_salina.2
MDVLMEVLMDILMDGWFVTEAPIRDCLIDCHMDGFMHTLIDSFVGALIHSSTPWFTHRWVVGRAGPVEAKIPVSVPAALDSVDEEAAGAAGAGARSD